MSNNYAANSLRVAITTVVTHLSVAAAITLAYGESWVYFGKVFLALELNFFAIIPALATDLFSVFPGWFWIIFVVMWLGGLGRVSKSLD